MRGPSQFLRQAGVRTLVALCLAGCGGGASTPVATPKPVVLRAPNCTHDPKWTVELDIAGVAQVATVNGAPSFVSIDGTTRTLEVEDVETRNIIAKAKLPVSEDVFLFPLAILDTPTGTVVLVSASTYSEDDEHSEYNYFLVRFDAANEPSLAKLELALEDSYSTTAVAVGDHLVVTTVLDYNEDTGAEKMYVGVFDQTGKLVHVLDEPSTESIIPVGPTTFAVHARVTSGHTVVRVFDTQRLDWTGPALPLTQQLHDWVSLGGRAIVVGFDSPDDENADMYQVSLAALDATGTLTPWQPLGITADSASFVAKPDGSALLLARTETDLRLFAVGPDLKVLPGAAPIPPPPAGFGLTPFVGGDNLYVASMRSIERYSCK